jgi:hypothetical protein
MCNTVGGLEGRKKERKKVLYSTGVVKHMGGSKSAIAVSQVYSERRRVAIRFLQRGVASH